MILDILVYWGVAGALLTMFLPVPANKRMFWIDTIVCGMFKWIALYILYLLRKHLGVEYSLWRGE